MKKILELPLTKPLYSTYHSQGEGGAVGASNNSLVNWYFNEAILLECNRKFLTGYTTPEITVQRSNWFEMPCLEKNMYDTKYLGGYTNSVIRALLNDGYYVLFGNVDDYYIEGKSFYKTRHFAHDGMIYGYDQIEKTFSMFAYDSNWIYRVFKTSQKGFNKGRNARAIIGEYSTLYAIKAKDRKVVLNINNIYLKLKEYLDCSIEKYPIDGEGSVVGFVVHDYILMYLGKLIDGSIPYERLDRRVFRMIAEHKKVMLERIKLVEDTLGLSHSSSEKYKYIADETDSMRMIYASYHLRKRDALLNILQRKLENVRNTEYNILSEFTEKIEGCTAIQY